MITFETVTLNPDLQGHIREDTIPILHTPLVVFPMYTPHLNDHINQLYAKKLQIKQRYYEEKEWHGYIFVHERPYRLEALLEILPDLTDREAGSLLSRVYLDSEFPWRNRDVWVALFSKYRRWVMTKSEKQKLDRLPQTIRVYRGAQSEDGGLSWTLDKKTAQFFADRFNRNGIVMQKTIRKEDVLCLLDGRNEQEVILNF